MIADIDNVYLRRLAIIAFLPFAVLVAFAAAALDFIQTAFISVALSAYEAWDNLIDFRIQFGEGVAEAWKAHS